MENNLGPHTTELPGSEGQQRIESRLNTRTEVSKPFGDGEILLEKQSC